jgi:uncharacterized protein (DUF1800 family)
VGKILILITILYSGGAWALSLAEARHLLIRTGFSPTAEEIEPFLSLTHAQAVDRLLDGVRQQTLSEVPASLIEPPALSQMSRQARKDLPRQERQKRNEQERKKGQALRGWWFAEMIATDSPLTERMVLFWHNHFATSIRKVRAADWMYQQNRLFRRHALGSFRELLHAVAKDPAMLVYLDGRRNAKQQPNENFARELLELFTLGEGKYSEKDVRAAARAFTGWGINPRDRAFRFLPKRHDFAVKRFMGYRGRLNGEMIIEMLLANPRTAEFIVEKLWKEFISATPKAKAVKAFASLLRKQDYALKPLLRAMLNSAEFRDVANRNQLIKSPVEYLVGTVRLLGIDIRDGKFLARASRRMGQDLFAPPNVKGWPGGTSWITSDSLLNRMSVMARLKRGMNGSGQMQQMKQMKAMQGLGDPDVDHLLSLDNRAMAMIITGEQTDLPDRGMNKRRWLARLLKDARYHLK